MTSIHERYVVAMNSTTGISTTTITITNDIGTDDTLAGENAVSETVRRALNGIGEHPIDGITVTVETDYRKRTKMTHGEPF